MSIACMCWTASNLLYSSRQDGSPSKRNTCTYFFLQGVREMEGVERKDRESDKRERERETEKRREGKGKGGGSKGDRGRS